MFMLIIHVIAIVLALTISQQHRLIAASIVIPVNKHTDIVKPLYTALAHFNTSSYLYYSHQNDVPSSLPQNLLILDLDAPFIWHYSYPPQESCDSCPYPVTCEESSCTDLRTTFSYQSLSPSTPCPPSTNSSLYEGYSNCEVCPVNIINPVRPVTGSCDQVIITHYEIMFPLTNGEVYITYLTAGSAHPWNTDRFPAKVFGVIALSSSPYALPAYLRDPVRKVTALCLPSSLSAPGALFLGAGPYYLPPPRSHVDVRSFLSYVNLRKHPIFFGYFIGVEAIVIKNRSISVPENVTAKISTLDPYTTLRTDVYNGVVRRFLKVTKRIPRAKAVQPFGVCFNVSSGGNGTKVSGVKVANIDLMLEGGKKWSISTANSMKQVTDDVACLAVVDGGPMSEHAIVVGAYQLEDNFLVFDLENGRFGFSSSLLRRQTSCSSFK
ncbi:hypothetical protein SSX86_011500 [Deinandra increscens subsp. villosa]|uniref:Peptidase A1 domain-containing protein n=1 Tax=Deinandra increscens subsp. villosa TaxID=3103831 RepID=A0AAP0D6P9_9ASTR